MAATTTRTSAADFLPASRDLEVLAEAARSCRGCELYRDAEQTVFGAGPDRARMLLVGEQPGDREDRAGAPFVGPAGRLLDEALVAAQIDREHVYLTNVVKHFKFTRAEGSARRIHKTPSRTEVVSCRPWLFAELQAIEPDVVVLLGATAAKALLGNDFRLTQHRGEVLRATDVDVDIVATIHPSAILRGSPDQRESALADLAADLRTAAGLLSDGDR